MNEEELIEEVLELTEMLRTSVDFEELRRSLAHQNIDVRTAMLISFHEDEDMLDYGVVIAHDKLVYEFERNNAEGTSSNFEKWTKLADLGRASLRHPQIPVAMAILDAA